MIELEDMKRERERERERERGIQFSKLNENKKNLNNKI
jgi:hypothetical protein